MVSPRRGRVFQDGVPKLWIGFAVAIAALGGALACNAILGLGDYAVGDGGTNAGGDGATGDCNGSLEAGQCYSCTPSTNNQLENACTTSLCQPFDDTTRIPNFDASLPVIPDVPDGG